MPNVFVANELSLPRLLFEAALGKRPKILATAAILPFLQPYLVRIISKLAQTFGAEMLAGSSDNLQLLKEYPAGIMLYNIFERTEGRLSVSFEFESLDRQIPDYAMACKHAVCTYSAEKHLQVLLLKEFEENSDDEPNSRIFGLTSLTQTLFESYYGQKIRMQCLLVHFINKPVNLLLCILVIAVGLVFGLSRWRPFGIQRKHFFLSADFINDKSDLELFEALSAKGPMCFVMRRGLKLNSEMLGTPKNAHVCTQEDGRLDTIGLLGFIKCLIKDSLRLFLRFKNIEPGLYYRFAMLPYRRLVMRSLFDCYRPKNFWARDLYSPEHIIRTQELHRVGAKSHSFLHGFGGQTSIIAQFRYISFDRFYVFGRFLVDKYYGDTWDPDMDVIPVGSFRGAQINCEGARDNNAGRRDILVLMSFLARYNNVDAKNIIRGLAIAFPERTVRLEVKVNFRNNPVTQDFIRSCCAGLDNVLYVDGPFYDYIKLSGYAFSDPSTVIMECIQYGIPAFMVDVLSFHQTSHYRDYPEICITSAEQAIEKINRLESGDVVFNTGDYEDMISMSVDSPQKVICEGMDGWKNVATTDTGQIVDECGE